MDIHRVRAMLQNRLRHTQSSRGIRIQVLVCVKPKTEESVERYSDVKQGTHSREGGTLFITETTSRLIRVAFRCRTKDDKTSVEISTMSAV